MAFFRYILIGAVIAVVLALLASFVLKHKLRRRSPKDVEANKPLPIRDWVSEAGLQQIKPVLQGGHQSYGPRALEAPPYQQPKSPQVQIVSAGYYE